MLVGGATIKAGVERVSGDWGGAVWMIVIMMMRERNHGMEVVDRDLQLVSFARRTSASA
jgi:hypothetical protein